MANNNYTVFDLSQFEKGIAIMLLDLLDGRKLYVKCACKGADNECPDCHGSGFKHLKISTRPV